MSSSVVLSREGDRSQEPGPLLFNYTLLIHYTQPSVAMLVGDMFVSVFVIPAAAGSGGAAV